MKKIALLLILTFLIFPKLVGQNQSSNEIKELKNKVEKLELKIDLLESKIKLLELKLSSLLKEHNIETTSTKKIEEKTNVNKVKVTSSRCTATTKKGTRCKRNARSNGRCWQHGG